MFAACISPDVNSTEANKKSDPSCVRMHAESHQLAVSSLLVGSECDGESIFFLFFYNSTRKKLGGVVNVWNDFHFPFEHGFFLHSLARISYSHSHPPKHMEIQFDSLDNRNKNIVACSRTYCFCYFCFILLFRRWLAQNTRCVRAKPDQLHLHSPRDAYIYIYFA